MPADRPVSQAPWQARSPTPAVLAAHPAGLTWPHRRPNSRAPPPHSSCPLSPLQAEVESSLCWALPYHSSYYRLTSVLTTLVSLCVCLRALTIPPWTSPTAPSPRLQLKKWVPRVTTYLMAAQAASDLSPLNASFKLHGPWGTQTARQSDRGRAGREVMSYCTQDSP